MGFHSYLTLAALTAACLLSGRTLIHYFQLESYQFPGYFRTLRRRFPKALIPGALLNIVWVGGAWALVMLIPEGKDWIPAAGLSALLIAAGLAIRKGTREKQESIIMTQK